MSGNLSTSASDLILGGLLNINAYAPGQPLNAQIGSVCMQTLNDLLDSLSTDQAFIYTQTENILAWTPGQYQYTVGNPVGGTFTGYTTTGSPTITGITNAPTTTFGINSTGQTVGGTLTDVQAAIPAGTTIVSYNPGGTFSITFSAPPTGSSEAITAPWAHPTGLYLVSFSDGEARSATLTNSATTCTWTPALTGTPTTAGSVNTNTLTMSTNATQTLTAGDLITYTTPGNFAISRPLRLRSSFTRVTTSAATGLDYFFDIVSFDRYNEIGLKSVPGPWPYICAYQPTYPLANLWVYPNPSIGGAVYLYTDLILTEFTGLTQAINLPQGYARALKKLLALELCPMFGKTPSPQLILQAKEAKNLLMAQNSSPVVTLRYDSDLIYSRHTDASWIVSGGFV